MGETNRALIEVYEEAVAAILAGDLDYAAKLTGTNGYREDLEASLTKIADEVKQQKALHDAQWRAVSSLGCALEREEVLDEIFRSFHELVDFDRLAYAQLTPEGLVETVWVRADKVSDEGVGYRAPLGAGSLSAVLQAQEPRAIADLTRYVQEHPRSASTRRMLEFGIRSSLTCPLVAPDRPVGFLFFSSSQPGTLGTAQADAIRPLLAPASHALAKSEMVRELTRMREALTAANRRLSSMARSDALTGIANRRHFDESIAAEVARARRFGTPLSLLMVDIDFFKNFNDFRGHHIGDDALRLVASTLVREVRRDGDLAARYGGEEFAVILPQTANDAAVHVAERILRSTRELSIPHPASPFAIVTVSIGVSTLGTQADGDALALVAAADGALYRAKANGRDRVHADSGDGLRRMATGPSLLSR